MNHLAITIFLTHFESDLKSLTPSCLVLLASGGRCSAVMIDLPCIHGVPGTQSRRRRRLRVTAHLHVQDAPQCRRYVRKFVAVTPIRSADLSSFEISVVLGLTQLILVVGHRHFGTTLRCSVLGFFFCDCWTVE